MTTSEKLQLRQNVYTAHAIYLRVWHVCCDPAKYIDDGLFADWTNAVRDLTDALQTLLTHMLAEAATSDDTDELSRIKRLLALIVDEDTLVHQRAR